MVKMKDSVEIGQFIRNKIKERNMKPIELAEKLANEKDGKYYTKNDLRDLVYKWLNGKRTPGIEYVYYLSKILEVSIEELLVAGEVCEKYENRPFTLYAIAKSGNLEQLDEIMKIEAPDGTIIGRNNDEYDKTILDYAVEFENIKMIKYMIEKKYVNFQDYGAHISTVIQIGNQCTYTELTEKILNLAIKYDDAELFSQMINKETKLRRKGSDNNDIYCKVDYYGPYFDLDESVLINILKTKNIFNYLSTPYLCSSLEVWNSKLNYGFPYVSFYDRKTIINDKVAKIQRLPMAFNILLDTALRNDSEKIVAMINVIKRHNSIVENELEQLFDIKELRIDEFGNYRTRGYNCGSLSNVGRVQKRTFDLITDKELKEELKQYVGE